MPKMSIDSKKGVPRFALVAFKDLLESHVYATNDISGPKSMGTGATVKTTIHGDIFKGTIVSMADNENYLKQQSQSLNVTGFFGVPKSKKSLGRGKNLPKKTNIPPTNETSQQLTSTPSSSKYRRLSVRNLPSPINHTKTTISEFCLKSLKSLATTFASKLSSAQNDSADDVDFITISLVEASFDSSSYAKQLEYRESFRNQPRCIKDVPDYKVDLSMNFSSFSSTIDSLQSHIHPLISVTTNIPNNQSPVEIPSPMNVATQHMAGTLNGAFTSVSSLMDTVALTRDVSKLSRQTRIPVFTSSTTKPGVVLDRDNNTISSELHSTRNVDTDVYLNAFFPPSPCSLPSVQDDTRSDFDGSFNIGGRMEATVILDCLSEDELTSIEQSSVSKEIEFPSKPPTSDNKSPVFNMSVTPESSGCACNTRMYNFNSEGDVHMVTIQDSKTVALTIMDRSELQYHSFMNSSDKENISPKTQFFDEQIKCYQDRFLQITPTELFYGLMLRSDYPPRMDDVSFFTETILLHLTSVSSRPEVFARNLLYRMFTLAELQNSSVYGRGFTNEQRNTALNVDKIRLIRELTFVLYSNVRFSWRNCVLWMDKSIKYVNKLL
ncbi:hypothetical protein LOTGIDRAFT_175116 [Lottia gigantea]|uniref:BEN domain-containing protein n=1 Tax=Lottia gigantea TaxID=225164 RepID=V4ALH2_LOTGI|nr:hypothetical protein LOTGIDRAFT_175116 [Lottia gigantea]ESO95610.1 hypothetical protein LOTGIDRAFT_175116 [Lottia gigantea]